MSELDWLAERFESQRDRLLAVAYRMLGSLSEAEDAVQECWLRLSRSDTNAIENLSGWLTTVVSRVCLDMLRSRKIRREESLEHHLPETFANRDDRSNPEQETLLADSVGLALLVVLDSLSPAERITLVLHDIFAMPFSEIAAIVDKSEAAVRQLASRARRKVQGARAVPESDIAQQRALVDAFLAAAHAGNFDALVEALAPDVVLRDDRQTDRQTGAASLIRGAKAIAGQVSGRAQAAQSALVNGSVGVIVAPRGKLLYVIKFTMRLGKIAEIDLISTPVRIRQLDLAVL